jgi:hypothetical protein
MVGAFALAMWRAQEAEGTHQVAIAPKRVAALSLVFKAAAGHTEAEVDGAAAAGSA